MTENRWNRDDIRERTELLCRNVADAAKQSGRTPSDIAIMAVTKTVPAEYINFVFEQCKMTLFGENRAQELCEKYPQYGFGSENIHFIGALQTNKVRQIVDKVSCIQSVDSLKLAKEISKRSAELGKTMKIMLEVNIGGEQSKAGVSPAELLFLLEQTAVLPSILVCGLMAIPPADAKNEETRRYFEQMYKLFVDIKGKKIDNVSIEYLSMGMSGDYALAIAEGANLIRVGSGIFGKRNYPVTMQ